MITVNVLINGNTILTRSARNITLTVQPNADSCNYLLDDGRIIHHNRSDGLAVLAAKMLNGVINLDQSRLPWWARFGGWLLSLTK